MGTQRRRDRAAGTSPQARIAAIMVNAGNADKLATFWAALLGTTVSARFDQFVWLKPAGARCHSGTAAAAP
jgi:hypothetical protein